jgi:hypothetical protein
MVFLYIFSSGEVISLTIFQTERVRSCLKQPSTSSPHWSAFNPVIKDDGDIIAIVPVISINIKNIVLVVFVDTILLFNN